LLFPRRPLSFRLPAADAKTEAAGSWSCGFQLCSARYVVVPHGVEHRTCADEEACIWCFEPAETLNT